LGTHEKPRKTRSGAEKKGKRAKEAGGEPGGKEKTLCIKSGKKKGLRKPSIPGHLSTGTPKEKKGTRLKEEDFQGEKDSNPSSQ